VRSLCNSQTTRHLAEFHMIEPEMAFADMWVRHDMGLFVLADPWPAHLHLLATRSLRITVLTGASGCHG